MNNRITIFDTTLRDGEQAPGASMTVPEKVEIAQALAELGVDVIEAGFPVSSPAQFQAVEEICARVEGPVICALARATMGDIEAAGKALAGGKRTRIHTFIATSDIHIDGKFADKRYGETLEEKRKTIKRMAFEAVKYARTFTDDVEFSAEDAGRTDVGFLCEVIRAAVDAGATTINVPDTTGYCLPHEYAELFSTLIETCNLPENVILSTHCHDDLGLAVANSIAGVRAGARQVECTVNGIGERAGNAALEEIVMAMRVRNDHTRVDTKIDATKLMQISRLVSTYSGFPVQPNKAIVGRNAFSHEAGIHQDGVLKRRDTYEIMRAEDVGQQTEAIRLGRHSGRHGFFSRLEKLGLKVSDEHRQDAYSRFLALADQKKEIYDEDLKYLVDEAAGGEEFRPFTIERLDLRMVTGRKPEAEVCLRNAATREINCESAVGDGPVDAVYRAIDHAIGSAHELSSYTIRSLTEGQDALGEVSVRIVHAGKFFMGRARNTDILRASADAYIDAINQLYALQAGNQFATEAIMDMYRYGSEQDW